MNPLFDDRLARLRFSRAATAIALRSVATCPGMCFQPLGRPIIGIGLFSVMPDAALGYRFSSTALSLRDGALPITLLDWLEPQLPQTGAIVSFERDGSLLWKLAGLADSLAHPRIGAFVGAPGDQLRVLQKAMMRGAAHGSASGVPCLCTPEERSTCRPELPPCLLPDPDQTERQLVTEAEDAWACWADGLATFDDHAHPARVALRLFDADRRARAIARHS